jgi:Ser/Thr protein kinase RdoA (MazF antagonist)
VQAREAATGAQRALRCYLKVYRDDHGGESFRLLQSLAAERADTDAASYTAVKPIAYLSELRTLVLEEAAGTPLQELLLTGGDPVRAGRAVGRAVAAFNQDPVPVTRRHSLADQLKQVQRAATLLEWACPDLRADVAALTDTVTRGLVDAPPMPMHRDLKTDHVFLSGDRVIFIDLDSVALGDPVRDPAHLYAHLVARVGMDELPPARARAAATAFVDEYFALVPKPWRSRFPLHAAGALLEVARGIFKRQEPRWRDKVATAIGAAHATLSETRTSRAQA